MNETDEYLLKTETKRRSAIQMFAAPSGLLNSIVKGAATGDRKSIIERGAVFAAGKVPRDNSGKVPRDNSRKAKRLWKNKYKILKIVFSFKH